MEEYESPEEWLENLGKLAKERGRVIQYVMAYFSLKEEHGLSREEALSKALENIDEELRSQVIDTIGELEASFPGKSFSIGFEEMHQKLQDIGLDDSGPLEPLKDESEGESG